MDSKILASLSFDPGILIIGMIIIMLGMLIYIFLLHRRQEKLERKYRSFMRGSRGAKTLSDALENKLETINNFTDTVDQLNDRISKIESGSGRAYRKMGVVKYDAFKELGGKLSFAYALLDDMDNGIIINSIYSKDGCYSYIKEIIKGESFLPLGEEEAKALEIAKQYGLSN